MENKSEEQVFESISKIEETKNESFVEPLKPNFVKKTNCLKECLSECDCVKVKDEETKQNLEIEQIKEKELLKEVNLINEPEPVKTYSEPESKKKFWSYLNPFSWKFSKSKK